MSYSSIIVPKVANGWVSRQTNLGMATYDLDELYSPDTDQWKSKVLDLASPKYPPQKAANPTQYIFDRSRYNNHGTITGATWVQLSSGLWALSFDGSDDRVDLTAEPLAYGANLFSVVAWFKKSNATNQCLWSNNVGGSNQMMLDVTTVVVFSTYEGGYGKVTGLVTVNDNVWHQAVITRSAATTGNVYVDGAADVLAGVIKNPTGTVAFSAFGVEKFGASSFARYFGGSIALVRIFSRVLSLAEITSLYNQERSLFGV